MFRSVILATICIILFVLSCGQAPRQTAVPKHAAGWTTDLAHVFTKEQVSALDALLNQFERETTNEIAIVTLDSTHTSSAQFDAYIVNLSNEWGVGKNGLNNGILIGISTQLRRIRISNGRGIEQKLSNEATEQIIKGIMLPDFKEGRYFDGTRKGLLAIMQQIR